MSVQKDDSERKGHKTYLKKFGLKMYLPKETDIQIQEAQRVPNKKKS